MISTLSDKYKLYKAACRIDVDVPKTFLINNYRDFKNFYKQNYSFPLFIKGNDVNSWRKNISNTKKGYLVNDQSQLDKIINIVLSKNVDCLIQEVIVGPDDNNYKGCVYIAKNKKIFFFSLQKIHHNPIHYGIGSLVVSKKIPGLEELTKKLFCSIDYQGVGSAEFKIDDRDGKIKLIEINPRYWQQNSLAEICGINFPLIDYLDSLNIQIDFENKFQEGVKWVNLNLDYNSFLSYRKEGSMSFWKWIQDLKGKKIISYLDVRDPLVFIVHLYRLLLSKLVRLIKRK